MVRPTVPSVSFLLLSALLLIPANLLGQTPALGSAQTTGSVTPSTGGAIIRGRIVAADTGLPLRGARVQLTSAELSAPRTATTDLDGKYEFKELAAGRYLLTASAASFIGMAYGQTRPFEAGKPIALGDKQILEDITLRLPVGGAIAGVVLGDGGEPLINATVTALRAQFVGGRRRLVSAGTARTNDLGEYRMFGLSPGSYVVSAGKRSLLSPGWTITAETGYAPAYFPGTPNASDARPAVSYTHLTLPTILRV